jgi:hypothetical protein
MCLDRPLSHDESLSDCMVGHFLVDESEDFAFAD